MSLCSGDNQEKQLEHYVRYQQHQYAPELDRNTEISGSTPELLNQTLHFKKDLQVTNMHIEA